MDNIYIRFGTKLYRQIVGIPMGTNCAPLVADLFLYYELISKFNVGLKSLLPQGLSEPEFYGDLVYKFKKIRGITYFSDQFRKL